MVATVIIAAVIAVALFVNIRRMIANVKAGKSIDGCDGDCSHCSQCH
jgi:hypothetical protein